MAEEIFEYDLIIVGAGPAGLSCAIKYAQLCKQANKTLSVCILEKGAQVGAHLLSGAIFDPKALYELLPDWQSLNLNIETKVSKDVFYFLTQNKAWRLPVPLPLQNDGNYIISLDLFCHALAKVAEQLGCDIFTGFAAKNVLFNEKEEVIGVITNDKGRDKEGNITPQFQPGVKLLGKQVILAEGCRGSLSQEVIAKYDLAKGRSPQKYGIGVKEVWEIESAQHRPGKVVHTLGWPLKTDNYGGSFIYHWGKNLLSLGLVIALDYKNPYLSPFQELQRFKHHPLIKPLLKNGRAIGYGARALNEGGWQSLPQLTFPGGMLIGCSAGFLNAAKLKGNHYAMKSGMLAAESVFEALQKPTLENKLVTFEQKISKSFIAKELKQVRNIRPGFRFGLWPGLMYAAFDAYLFRGYAPWTFQYAKADYQATGKASQFESIQYPKPDGVISFDKMTALRLSNVYHRENQPNHLLLLKPENAIKINWQEYAGLEQYYCPAGVYEFIEDSNRNYRLQINAANCIHCKTCDIKDPTQNIRWTPPEGGDGPNYFNM